MRIFLTCGDCWNRMNLRQKPQIFAQMDNSLPIFNMGKLSRKIDHGIIKFKEDGGDRDGVTNNRRDNQAANISLYGIEVTG